MLNKKNKKLKIIGLGRCVIGHLAKYLNANHSDSIVFKHYYLLNYTTCLYSSYSKEDIPFMNSAISVPSVSEQIRCLEDINKYDICALELFPPSGLYKHKSKQIYTCFESFTDDLSSLGFYKYIGNSKEFTKDSKDYILSIEKLVKRIKSINNNIKIIIVNGELVKDISRVDIGSQLIFDILNDIKNSNLINDNLVELLDINDLITNLEQKKETYFEMAFPYLYINHTQDLVAKKIARDCKHTTSYIRMNFLKSFCDIIKSFGINSPKIRTNNKKLQIEGKDFSQRANSLLNQIMHSPTLFDSLEDAKELSLFISYALQINHQFSKEIINKFILTFSKKHPVDAKDLKDSFYHMRTLCAYIYEEKPPILKELIHLSLAILQLEKNDVKPYTNFALLWITNIYLACLSIIDKTNDEDIKLFDLLLNQLSQDTYYKKYSPIKKILSNSLNING